MSVFDTGVSISRTSAWHLERGVPVISLITVACLFLGQTATAMWFASKLDSRVEAVERAVVLAAPQADRLTRVEVKLEAIADGVKDIQYILRSRARAQ